MKINSLLFGLLTASISFSSCNLDSDEDDNYMNNQYACCNLVVPTKGDPFATRANYTMSLYYTDGTISVATNNLSLGNGNKSFTTHTMPCDTKYYVFNGQNLDVTSFSGGFANNGEIVVQNVSGYLSSIFNVLGTNDPIHPEYKFVPQIPVIMSYNVNNAYTVKTFMADAIYTGNTRISTAAAPSAPFETDAIRYRVVFDYDLKKADIIFYNAKFAERMPVTINFIVEDLDVTFNNNGYVLSGRNLTPQLYEGNAWTPAPNYKFVNFEFMNTSDNLTMANATYTVEMGQAQYQGDFQGYYALTKSRQ